MVFLCISWCMCCLMCLFWFVLLFFILPLSLFSFSRFRVIFRLGCVRSVIWCVLECFEICVSTFASFWNHGRPKEIWERRTKRKQESDASRRELSPSISKLQNRRKELCVARKGNGAWLRDSICIRTAYDEMNQLYQRNETNCRLCRKLSVVNVLCKMKLLKNIDVLSVFDCYLLR